MYVRVNVVARKCLDKLVLPRQLEALIKFPVQQHMTLGVAITTEVLEHHVIRDSFDGHSYSRFNLIMQGTTPKASMQSSQTCVSPTLCWIK